MTTRHRGRDAPLFETTMAAERLHNVHGHEGIGVDAFVSMRNARDATLGPPG